jgi:uncharacterized OsmC-like protein
VNPPPDSGPPAGELPEGPAAGDFAVVLTRRAGYAFDVDPGVPGAAGFVIDEPAPLGAGSAASPARALVSALAACLGSTLLYCLAKSRIEVRDFRIEASGQYVRNERGRLRLGGLHVKLFPDVAAADVGRMQRCLEVFEDYCILSESLRQGLPVVVGVETHSS